MTVSGLLFRPSSFCTPAYINQHPNTPATYRALIADQDPRDRSLNTSDIQIE